MCSNTYYNYYYIGNIDYDPAPYVLTIPAGMTSITFNTTMINDDNTLEDNETFYLSINSSSLPSDITAGNPFQVVVTITDDDCKCCYLSKTAN